MNVEVIFLLSLWWQRQDVLCTKAYLRTDAESRDRVKVDKVIS